MPWHWAQGPEGRDFRSWALFLKKKNADESTATDQAPTVTSHVTVAIGHHDEH